MRALVDATDTLAGQNADGTVERLVTWARLLLGNVDVSVALLDERGRLAVAASSSERKLFFETYQIDQVAGPTIDSYRRGVENAFNLGEGGAHPWPEVARLGRAIGYSRVRSLPLRWHATTIGVLSVAEEAAYPVAPHQVFLLRTLVDSTAIGLVNRERYGASLELSVQLRGALKTRMVIEQAKGAVAAHLGVSVDDAFALLRRYARSNNKRLNDVSNSVLDGSLPIEELLNAKGRLTGSSRSARLREHRRGRGVGR